MVSLRHTPSTIPVGKMMPHASTWMRMWVHSIESIGSFDTASPTAILLTPWSCAATVALNSRAARAAPFAGSPIVSAVVRRPGWRISGTTGHLTARRGKSEVKRLMGNRVGVSREQRPVDAASVAICSLRQGGAAAAIGFQIPPPPEEHHPGHPCICAQGPHSSTWPSDLALPRSQTLKKNR
jgi:hypothetical protein